MPIAASTKALLSAHSQYLANKTHINFNEQA